MSPVQQNWRNLDFADSGKPVVNITQRNGRCPNKLGHFNSEKLRSIGKLWFHANLDPPRAQFNHDECTLDQCRQLQVDLRDYKTTHSVDGCDCKSRGPMAASLAEVVLNGAIPLVYVTGDAQSEKMAVHLQSRDPAMQFFPFSHVWADGHGNLSESALPQCTLRKIQNFINLILLRSRNGSIPFWTDSLCPPKLPRELRNKALSRPSDPLGRARYVLVLDSYLRNPFTAQMTPVELFALLPKKYQEFMDRVDECCKVAIESMAKKFLGRYVINRLSKN